MKNNVFPLIALGNDAPVVPDHGSNVGVIGLANESRLVAATYSEALTQFTVGYRDPENLLAAVDYLAPPIPVGRRFEWKKADNAQAFLAETDDERAIGGGFKRVEYAGSTQLGKTGNRGLSYILDIDEDGGATTEESVVAMLQQRIIRNKYRRAMTALLALNAGDAAIFSAATQPDELVKAALAAAQLVSGVFPNRGLFGLAGWNLRSTAYAGNDKAGAFAGLMKKPAEVAGDLMLSDLRVDKAVYQSAAAAKSRIVGSNFFAVVAYDGMTKDDPSHLKQFYTPTAGGRFRVFRKVTGPADKFVEIIVEHYESIVGTSTVGSARLNITAS
ncbi:MAG: hypothetical protein Q8J78_05915 [Moraxellaceae bacterium]|nr:hypothetical protein [Moraxellaceae bacterium]